MITHLLLSNPDTLILHGLITITIAFLTISWSVISLLEGDRRGASLLSISFVLIVFFGMVIIPISIIVAIIAYLFYTIFVVPLMDSGSDVNQAKDSPSFDEEEHKW